MLIFVVWSDLFKTYSNGYFVQMERMLNQHIDLFIEAYL